MSPSRVAFSGGVDSTAVLLLAGGPTRRSVAIRTASARSRSTSAAGAMPRRPKASCASLVSRRSGSGSSRRPPTVDLEAAIRLIEDYHPLDVECAAAAVCLLRGIRERYPRLTHLLDGDGGDENLKSYPLEDSDLTLSSILRNPLLYQEGWGVDAIKHSLAYSGGLSRGYVRTYAPAAAFGFTAFSPFTTRSVIASAVAIPFEQVLGGDASRLNTLKQDVVSAGIKAALGVDMPVNPKRRFQDGAAAMPARARVEGVVPRTFNSSGRTGSATPTHSSDAPATRWSGSDRCLHVAR